MPKKVDIKTGFLCNNNCLFCVQAHKKMFGNRPGADIRKDLDDAKKSGCKSVCFTGGEVTIRKDLIDLVRYAKSLGFEVQLQTNARMLSSMDYCKALIRAGVDDFAPALHGHTAKLHDFLTSAPGSFEQTTQAIRNLKSLGQRVTMNTVVVKPNYRHVPEIAGLLVSLGVDQFQFAFVHACGNALDNYEEMMPRVSEAAPYIQKGLQIGIDNNIPVMAEAMPMCHMKGYEKFCSEWYIPETEIRDIGSYDPDFARTRRTEGKVKFPQCRLCKYDNICEGPWKEYPERMGNSEFQPVGFDEEVLKMEEEFLGSLSGDVLDIGCGYLFRYPFYEKAMRKGARFHCIDPNPSLLLVEKRIPKDLREKIKLEQTGFNEAELKTYDNIILRYSFNHLGDQEKAVRKIAGALKPGGRVFLLDGSSKTADVVSTLKKKKEDYITSAENGIKSNLKIYRKFLTESEYRQLEKDVLKFYIDEPDHGTIDDNTLRLFTKHGMSFEKKFEGYTFGEVQVCAIMGKPARPVQNKPKTTLMWTLYDYTQYDSKDDFNASLPIAYLSKILDANDFPVKAIDASIMAQRWGYKNINKKNMREVLEKLVWVTEKTNPDILAVGFWSEGVTFVKEFARIMKKRNPDLIIVLGGALSTAMPETVADFVPDADYIIQGEGEYTLLELVKAIWGNKDTRKILGLSYRKNGKLVTNQARPRPDLDMLPLMDFENFVYKGKSKGMHFVTSRGCPNKCSYCAISSVYDNARFMSTSRVISQIKHLSDLYDLQYISFSDDNFMCNVPRTKKLLKALIQEKFSIKFPASARIESLNQDIYELLKPAGVSWLSIGVENMLPKVLKYYNRAGNVDYGPMLEKAMVKLKQYADGGAFSFIYGSPIETEKDIEHNLEWMEKIGGNGFRVYSSALRIVPGSPMWSDYLKGKVRPVVANNVVFPFDEPHKDKVWAVPTRYAVANNKIEDDKWLEILRRTAGRVAEIGNKV